MQNTIENYNKNRFSPFAVGFDELFERLFEMDTTSSTSYPPYNIIKTDECNYIIEMAVAGFELFGAKKHADLMRRANKIYTENRERLEEFDDGTMESFSESYKENPLNALDEEFYELSNSESLNQLRIAYIRQHPSEFTQK